MDTDTRSLEQWLLDWGEGLARHRLNQDLSQADLARKAGLSLRTLTRIESGKGVQLESFTRVLMALGLTAGMEGLVPHLAESPLEQLERKPRSRQRASRHREPPVPTPWSWGEDA